MCPCEDESGFISVGEDVILCGFGAMAVECFDVWSIGSIFLAPKSCAWVYDKMVNTYRMARGNCLLKTFTTQ